MELHPTNRGAIIDKISRNSHHWGSDRSFPKRKNKAREVDEVDSREDVRALNKKIDALATSLSVLHVQQSHKQPRVCAICTSSSHKEDDCPHTFPQEESRDVKDVNFLQRNQPSYGRDRDHPNFSYKTTEPIKYEANWRQKNNPLIALNYMHFRHPLCLLFRSFLYDFTCYLMLCGSFQANFRDIAENTSEQ
ncbi:unnamed protein product [Rhodiola kirilowii]